RRLARRLLYVEDGDKPTRWRGYIPIVTCKEIRSSISTQPTTMVTANATTTTTRLREHGIFPADAIALRSHTFHLRLQRRERKEETWASQESSSTALHLQCLVGL
ncbi:hypothetical protein M8C21_000934, partial [Ambrosia artemisiifolia]